MTERQNTLEINKLQKELIDLLFKRANLRKKTVARLALKEWAWDHVDRLTKAELKKYESIIL